MDLKWAMAGHGVVTLGSELDKGTGGCKLGQRLVSKPMWYGEGALRRPVQRMSIVSGHCRIIPCIPYVWKSFKSVQMN